MSEPQNVCPECQEPYLDGDVQDGKALCGLCEETHSNEAAEHEDALRHTLGGEYEGNE